MMEQLVTKKDVANLLKDARQKNRMSVDEVAAALKTYGYEIVPKSMYNYESGLSQPPVSMFLALCKIYGIEDLLETLQNGVVRKIEVSMQEEMLIEYFRQASPEAQELALKMLKPTEKDSTASKVG